MIPGMEHAHDVVILGGGLAGLTLARQILRERPGTDVMVVEKARFPLPEAAHKVGESTLESGAHYFRDVLGLGDHLEKAQLRKEGLRFFMPSDGNADITRRLEVGVSGALPTPTYQLDRGRFENALADVVREDGATVLDGTAVEDVEIDVAGHRVTLRAGEERRTVTARWVVDATGRRALLKQRLGLRKAVDHDINAVWFRLGDMIDLSGFANGDGAAEWSERVRSNRWQSTNHLMGPGYWTWLIPLGSGGISVGVVADERYVPWGEINRFERVLEWLHTNEPQVGAAVHAARASLQDFRVLRHYAHGCKQVFSADRWCLTGEAGVFLDPLYSPGSDYIGLSNGYITDLITRELGGEDIAARATAYDHAYLAAFIAALPTWRQQYTLMGHPQVWASKVVWDMTVYFGVNSPLFISGAFRDPEFTRTLGAPWDRFWVLSRKMQRFFREWATLDDGTVAPGSFVDLAGPLHQRLNSELLDRVDPDTLRDRIHANIARLEETAVEIIRHAARRQGLHLEPGDIDPTRFDLRSAVRAVPA